jgi:hypothetical protein
LREDCKYWKDKARIQILDSENVIPGLEDVEKDDLEIVHFVVDRMLDGEDFAYCMKFIAQHRFPFIVVSELKIFKWLINCFESLLHVQ